MDHRRCVVERKTAQTGGGFTRRRFAVLAALSLLRMLLFPLIADALSISRRQLVVNEFIACASVVAGPAFASSTTDNDDRLLNYAYTDSWTGTALPLLDLPRASQVSQWNMGRWPDPILRRPASPVDPTWYGTLELKRATLLLQDTCRKARAVGLAAQQCGIDARIVFLEPGTTMVNPKIVNRSDERDMRVWREHCLVLPPSFEATVLRDAWIDVEYSDYKGVPHQVRLRGELARAAQHELDHDRGILVLDHVDMDEMESAQIRAIETNGHDMRMALAFARSIEPSSFAG